MMNYENAPVEPASNPSLVGLLNELKYSLSDLSSGVDHVRYILDGSGPITEVKTSSGIISAGTILSGTPGAMEIVKQLVIQVNEVRKVVDDINGKLGEL